MSLAAACLYLVISQTPTNYHALGREIAAHVRDRFFDPEVARDRTARHQDDVRDTTDPEEFARRTRAALAELRTSHTGFYTPEDPEFHALRSIFAAALDLTPEATSIPTLGVDSTPDGTVRHVFEGGPAAGSGLVRGDRIRALNGQPYHPVRSLRATSGKRVRLEVERANTTELLSLELVPVHCPLRTLWLEHMRQGTRLITSPANHTLLYVPYYCGAGDEFTQELREILRGEAAAGAEALILDARDGWGGSPPDLVSLFDPAAPTLSMLGREGASSPLSATWKKPLVVLINGGTRSGKEIFAHAVKSSRRGRLVGERTAGAVVGGTPIVLSDGSLLLLAVGDVLVDGIRLEGVGVEPDVKISSEPLFGDSGDRQKMEALIEADRLIEAASPRP